MKEEQHANTSANYDVELLHHRDAHMEFKNGTCPRFFQHAVSRRLLKACGGDVPKVLEQEGIWV